MNTNLTLFYNFDYVVPSKIAEFVLNKACT